MRSQRILWMAIALLLVANVGCTAPGVRWSAIRWNCQSKFENGSTVGSRALQLANRPTSELKRLMTTMPSPAPNELVGKWYGVNKGYGAALAGLHQDVKVFRNCGHGVSGYNILVRQVKVEELGCEGWQPKMDRKTCRPKTMGNFIVTTHCKAGCPSKASVELDYSQGDNPRLDPSRYLVDELVVIEPGLLLGRARFKVGLIDVPVAYFVLSREEGSEHSCDGLLEESECDDFGG